MVKSSFKFPYYKAVETPNFTTQVKKSLQKARKKNERERKEESNVDNYQKKIK